MTKQSNLRNTPRLSRKSSDFWQININHDELITRNIIDVSPSGLSFKAPARSQFLPGQLLQLEISLDKEKQFETEGKVIWSKDGQFGIKLSRMPQFIDAFIMQTIQELAVQPLWKDERVAKSLSGFRSSAREWETKKYVSSAFALFTVAAMTAALVLASFLQPQRTDEKLSSVSSQFFQKFIKNGPGK